MMEAAAALMAIIALVCVVASIPTGKDELASLAIILVCLSLIFLTAGFIGGI